MERAIDLTTDALARAFNIPQHGFHAIFTLGWRAILLRFHTVRPEPWLQVKRSREPGFSQEGGRSCV
jgi:hypothetical protein